MTINELVLLIFIYIGEISFPLWIKSIYASFFIFNSQSFVVIIWPRSLILTFHLVPFGEVIVTAFPF